MKITFIIFLMVILLISISNQAYSVSGNQTALYNSSILIYHAWNLTQDNSTINAVAQNLSEGTEFNPIFDINTNSTTFNGASRLRFINIPQYNTGLNISAFCWSNLTGNNRPNMIMGRRSASENGEWQFFFNDVTDEYGLYFWDSGGIRVVSVTTPSIPLTNKYELYGFSLTQNSTTLQTAIVYYNTSRAVNFTAVGSRNLVTTNLFLADNGLGDNPNYLKGSLKGCFILNRTITEEEVRWYYEQGENFKLTAGNDTLPIINSSSNAVFNLPANNSITHNATQLINITITSGTFNNITNMLVFLDTNSNPIDMINSTNNTLQGNYTIFFTINKQVAGSINNTYYLKINITDNLSNVFSVIHTFNLTNNISSYNATNISLTPLPLSVNTDVKCHYNITNFGGSQINDNISITDLRWWINGTQYKPANNLTTLDAGNVTLNSNITCEVRINNGFGETSWTQYVNSSQATAGDTTNPAITAQAINGNSFTTAQRVNVSANCTDNNIVDVVRITHNGTGQFANSTMNLLGSNVYAYDALFAVGNYNFTDIYCRDGSGNIARDASNFTISVTSAGGGGSGGSGGGGGGGGSIPPQIVINQTNITLIENCNFNQICEGNLGEDPFGCPSDCKINTNYLFCDDPTQPCVTDTFKRLFTARSRILNISVLIGMISLAIVFIPNNSPIGKFIKKPLFRRKLK